MSIRDTPTIFRKEEESKRQRHKDQQQQEETSSKAHRLFSKGKKPVKVSIVLNVRKPAAAKYYREYWKLKRLPILNPIFKETDGKSRDTLKFYK